MATNSRVDWVQLEADLQAGMKTEEVAVKHGIAKQSVYDRKRRKAWQRACGGGAGSVPARRPRKAPREQVEVPEEERVIVRVPARTEPEAIEEKAGETPALPSTAQARCRVVMFEVEGSEAAVLDSVNAIKAALQARD